MEWAPDNSALSYLKYDERDVPEFNFMLYQGACDPKDQYALHPGVFSYKYPVAGEKNSHVTLHSYDVDTRKTKDIDLPGNDIEYLARIHYGPTADVLLVTTLNRNQNRMEIFSVNPRSTVSRSIYVDQSNAWITPQCYENISYGANDFVIFSDRTGYSHLYRYNYNGQKLAQLTSGDFDVTAYYGTADDGTYYYQSTNGTPINRVITKVNSKGVRTNITPAEGWASATFAAPMNYYVLSYSNATTPTVYTLMNSAKERAVRTLEDNAAYAARFASAPHKEFFTMQANGQTFNGWMIKPTNFDASKKYPAIIYQYSGPGSQEVANRWGMDWMQYFATQGYVIACIDGRGTGARGREFEQIVYKNLGHYETIDQNSLLTYLQQQPWIDADHIGIHGWSYGGYETLMAATSKAPYAAAVAVAPVTSWRYYDTIYAERYMSTPQQNADGYNSSAPVERTAQLSCPLLIMSGSADDNVHMSNTMEFMARLENNNKWADMLIFPNMNHSINGCNTRALVYSRMLHFFNSNLR
jgi:dipeptidyl-peptidase-4